MPETTTQCACGQDTHPIPSSRQEAAELLQAHTQKFTTVEEKTRPLHRGQCYATCWKLTMKDHNLTYVEGHADTPDGKRMEHAWCLRDGRVYDPTWGNQGSNYEGTPISRTYMLQLVPKHWDAADGLTWMLTGTHFMRELPQALAAN